MRHINMPRIDAKRQLHMNVQRIDANNFPDGIVRWRRY